MSLATSTVETCAASSPEFFSQAWPRSVMLWRSAVISAASSGSGSVSVNASNALSGRHFSGEL